MLIRSVKAGMAGVRWCRSVVTSAPVLDVWSKFQGYVNGDIDSADPCNFWHEVVDGAAFDPGRVAMRIVTPEAEADSVITYAELDGSSHKVARFLQQQGLAKGDSVALLAEKEPVLSQAYAGVLRAGLTAVPLSPQLTEKDLIHRFNDLPIQAVIGSSSVVAKIEAIRAHCSELRVLIAASDTVPPGWMSFEKQLAGALADVPWTTKGDDRAIVFYTSGTTGQPKGAQHSHRNITAHANTGRKLLGAGPKSRVMYHGDWAWGFRYWAEMGVWSMGSEFLVINGSKTSGAEVAPDVMLKLLQDKKVDVLAAPPVVLERLALLAGFAQAKLSLRRIVSVGEPLKESVVRMYQELHGVSLRNCYGQAETPPVLGFFDEQPYVSGSAGREIRPYRVEVVSDELRLMPDGEQGQLALNLTQGSSVGVTMGYANRPERTAKSRVKSPSGDELWLMGDRGVRENGLFKVCGRVDEVIKRRNWRIGPEEIEGPARGHAAVLHAAAFDARLNSTDEGVIKLVVVPHDYPADDSSASAALEADILTYLSSPDILPSYRCPDQVELVTQQEWDALRTTSGKLSRHAWRQRELEKAKQVEQASEISSAALCKLK